MALLEVEPGATPYVDGDRHLLSVGIVSDPIRVRPEKQYRISLATKIEKSDGRGVHFRMEFLRAPAPGEGAAGRNYAKRRVGPLIRGFGKQSVTEGWVTLESDVFSPPPEAVAARLIVNLLGEQGDRALVDNVAMVEVRAPPASNPGVGVPEAQLRAAVASKGGDAQSIQAIGSAHQIEIADTDGDAALEAIYATFDGRVASHASRDGRMLWSAESGSFPFDLATSDLDGDGKAEVLVAGASGRVSVFGQGGRARWTFDAGPPLHGVAVAKVGGARWVLAGGAEGKLHVLSAAGEPLGEMLVFDGFRIEPIRHIRTGNFDDDPDDEIVVATWKGQIKVLDPPSLETLWQGQLHRTESEPEASWARQSLLLGEHFIVATMNLADLDGDGQSEVMLGSTVVRAGGDVQILGHDGRLRLVIPGKSLQDVRSQFYSRGSPSRVVALSSRRHGTPVLAVLINNRLSLYDIRGEPIASAEAPMSFSDMVSGVDAAGNPIIYLASTPDGDDQIYRVDPRRGWDESFARLERTGMMRRITENLAKLERQIDAYDGKAPAKPAYLHTLDSTTVANAIEMRGRRSKIERLRGVFKKQRNLDFGFSLRVIDQEPVPGFEQERSQLRIRAPLDEILRAIDAIEEAGVTVRITAGHSNHPMISLETAEAILERCPKSCVGFQISENTHRRPGWEKYFEEFVIPLLEICKKHGKQLNWVEKSGGIFWVEFPALPIADRIFSGEFADAIIVNVENSDTRSPELSVAGRLGLLMSGAANHVGARAIHDDLRFHIHFGVIPVMAGHPFFRKQVTDALIGARIFDYNLRIPSQDIESFIQEEALYPLLRLLGKGLLVPPKPEDMLNVSRVALVIARPDPRALRDSLGFGGSEFYHNAAERRSPFEGVGRYWAAAPSQPHYLGRYLMGAELHALNHIPSTPFGLVAAVPEKRFAASSKYFDDGWKTDLYSFYREGRKLDGIAARDAVLASFEAAALKLPYRAEGRIFMQAQRMDAKTDRITLVDPGFIDPADRAVKLHFQSERVPREMVDLLSREKFALGRPGMTVDLTVPAGILRILEVRY